MTWVEIPGFEGKYSINENGDVLSHKYMRTNSSSILKQATIKGYQRVWLQNGSKGKQFMIHYLMAITFIGPRPQGKQINHIDGNKRNNTEINLEYITASENIKHSFRIGLQSNRGEHHSQSKLNNNKVLDIKQRLLMGETQTSIAASYTVDSSLISHIKSGRLWSHVCGKGRVNL